MRSLEELAYEEIKEIAEFENDELKKKVRAYLRRLPSVLMSTGLFGTVAFICKKANKKGDESEAYESILKMIMQMCKEYDEKAFQELPTKLKEYGEYEDYVKYLEIYHSYCYSEENSEKALALTGRLLNYLYWLKTFAEAMLPPEERGDFLALKEPLLLPLSP